MLLSNVSAFFHVISFTRGCSFVSKALEVEHVGAYAMIVTNSEKGDDGMLQMIKDDTGRTVNLPSVYLPGNHGLAAAGVCIFFKL